MAALRRGCGRHRGVFLATAGRLESQEEEEAPDSGTSESDSNASGVHASCCRPRSPVRKSRLVRLRARADSEEATPLLLELDWWGEKPELIPTGSTPAPSHRLSARFSDVRLGEAS